MGEAAQSVSKRNPVGRDQMEYLADMLRELQQMADAAGARTLASLIALAQVEASREASTRQG